jgi:hypothetical protein
VTQERVDAISTGAGGIGQRESGKSGEQSGQNRGKARLALELLR